MKKQSVFTGLAWGLTMYVLITFVFPSIGVDDTPITLQKSLTVLPIWLAGGLLFGFLTEKINAAIEKRKQKTENHEKMG
mgnify:CR=1 FL=1